jgi:hypothetical protein
MTEHQEMTAEQEAHSRQGLRLIVGAGLGYLVGKAIVDKPVLGAVVGGVLALIVGSKANQDG